MASKWSLPTKVISSETIEATVTIFVDAIKMTRCSNKFPRWRQSTVEKAFKWADTVEAVRSSIDSIQLEVAVSKIQKTDIGFIDANRGDVIMFPCLTLVKAILSSPLLPLSSEGPSIMRTCYRESVLRLGEEVSQRVFKEVSAVCMQNKDAADSINEQILAMKKNASSSSDQEKSYELSCDDILLATQLIATCCEHKEGSCDGLIPLGVTSKIQAAVQADLISLRMLCVGMTLTPTELYCASTPLPDTDPTSAPIPAHLSDPVPTTLATSSTPVLDTTTANSISSKKFMTTIDGLYEMTRNQQLWQIINDCANANITRFLGFDEDFTTFQLLLNEPSFARIAVASLIRMVNGIFESLESGLKPFDTDDLRIYQSALEVLLFVQDFADENTEILKNLRDKIQGFLRDEKKKRRFL